MWMAPEVLMNESFTFKADVYSFGVIIWELMTGKVPWKGMLPAQIICGVAFNGMRLAIPEDVEEGLASLMVDCWEEDPQARPTFDEIKERLKPMLQAAERADRAK
jgi:sterile alpha motif and leucine zipper-containing kinase AZK